jgi:predicted dehydrogenase
MNVRFGLVGLGGISTRFAAVLKRVKGVSLASVASREQTRSDVFARKFGAKHAYQDYQELIHDDEVDIVYIGLTNNLHYEIAKACLEHHKAVLCEKPLTMSFGESVKLVEMANKNKTLLMEALWTRCMPAFRKAQDWVKLGRIGEVELITANFCVKLPYDIGNRWFNPQLGGGSLFDLGVYPISLATGILGEHPEEVNGTAKIAPSHVDEAAVVSMRFPSGALANLNFGFSVDGPQEAWIMGTEGRIKLSNCYGPKKVIFYSKKGISLERFIDHVRDGFEHEVRHCAELFRAQKIESELISWKDTLATARIFDKLRKQWRLL